MNASIYYLKYGMKHALNDFNGVSDTNISINLAWLDDGKMWKAMRLRPILTVWLVYITALKFYRLAVPRVVGLDGNSLRYKISQPPVTTRLDAGLLAVVYFNHISLNKKILHCYMRSTLLYIQFIHPIGFYAGSLFKTTRTRPDIMIINGQLSH